MKNSGLSTTSQHFETIEFFHNSLSFRARGYWDTRFQTLMSGPAIQKLSRDPNSTLASISLCVSAIAIDNYQSHYWISKRSESVDSRPQELFHTKLGARQAVRFLGTTQDMGHMFKAEGFAEFTTAPYTCTTDAGSVISLT